VRAVGEPPLLSGMQDYKRLRVWHLARDLSVKVVQAFPERTGRTVPGLRSQAIRAAMSVAANLVEGCARATRTEFLHFVEIALASLNELEGHLLLGCDTGVIDQSLHTQLQEDVDMLRRMLIALMRTTQRHITEAESRARRAAAPGCPVVAALEGEES
jgi:four helix bundle protein